MHYMEMKFNFSDLYLINAQTEHFPISTSLKKKSIIERREGSHDKKETKTNYRNINNIGAVGVLK